ncbi:MAG TPA: hypothetical protein VK808_02530 [Bacteroidia bacterium]|jgi:hypothetical protein|nr:hypothetical protein [Bacteroidia bacterium]
MGKEVVVHKVIKLKHAFYFINFLLLTFTSVAQSDSAFIHKGLLRAAGTFAFGTMPQNSISNAYLTGNIEYYAEKKISVRGDLYYFLNSTTKNSPLNKNDALYFGAYYHIPTHSHFDPVLGLQPGISYTQMNIDGANDIATICPLASAVVGFNFFGQKWFHVQVNVRYTIGEHLTAYDETNISELSFNFGLGFNLNTRKKK